MIRTVIFDVDDTLYSFSKANKAAVEQLASYAFDQFGWTQDEYLRRQKDAMDDIKRYAGTSGGYRTRLVRFQNMLETAGLPIDPYAIKMTSIYKTALLDSVIPEEGVEDWFLFLKKSNIRIGVGSDATAHQQFDKLERLGFLRYIDFMVTSEEVGTEKPAAKFFARCKEKSQCAPYEVLFIGDNLEKDYKGAKSAGFQAVWYNPSGNFCDFQVPELHSYAEAPALLAEINKTGEMEENEE